MRLETVQAGDEPRRALGVERVRLGGQPGRQHGDQACDEALRSIRSRTRRARSDRRPAARCDRTARRRRAWSLPRLPDAVTQLVHEVVVAAAVLDDDVGARRSASWSRALASKECGSWAGLSINAVTSTRDAGDGAHDRGVDVGRGHDLQPAVGGARVDRAAGVSADRGEQHRDAGRRDAPDRHRSVPLLISTTIFNKETSSHRPAGGGCGDWARWCLWNSRRWVGSAPGGSAGAAVRRGHQQLGAAGAAAGAVGQQLAEVLEQDDAVAQQAPALLGVRDEHVRGVAVAGVDRRARAARAGSVRGLASRCPGTWSWRWSCGGRDPAGGSDRCGIVLLSCGGACNAALKVSVHRAVIPTGCRCSDRLRNRFQGELPHKSAPEMALVHEARRNGASVSDISGQVMCGLCKIVILP